MWSLPDINQLNARAAAEGSKIKRAIRRGPSKRQQCEYAGCNRQAAESVAWFDIFSDDAKGLIHVCDEHPAESFDGFFKCDACDRVVAENYTWERYQVSLGGRVLCLKCAAEAYFADKENWINPALVKCVAEPGLVHGPLFDPNTGVLNIAACKHVLANSQPLPAGVVFHDNFEFDSTDGHQISGRDPLEVIRELSEPFCPVLDTGWQFAVSIGLYLRTPAYKQQEAA